MKHTIPIGNWHIALADAIKKAVDGDAIAVHNEAMLELAIRAKRRMCPEKQIEFVVESSEIDQ